MIAIRTTVQKLFAAASSGPTSNLNVIQVRTKVRYHLPHPTETRRVRRQGFLAKVKTLTGRRLLMERILKGDKVISH